MRHLIVHVGPHKTGSTSIQRALFFASQELLKLGIYYPAEWLTAENAWSHYALFAQLRGKKFDLMENAAAQVLKSSANSIIISAEDLSLLSVEEINAMAQGFRRVEPNLKISIVFYIRRWAGLVPSVAQELIKQGISLTLSDIIAQELLLSEQSDIINYVNRLDRFAAVFGVDAVNIISFDNLVEAKQNLIDHFFGNVLGCTRSKSDTYDVDTQHNMSPSIVEVEFLRARNCLVKNGSINKFAGNADQYLQRLRASNYQELANVFRGSVRDLPIDETALPFRALYEALHAKYRRRFLNPVGPGMSDPLFHLARRNIAYVQPNYIYDSRVLNSLIVLNQNINDNKF